MSDNANPKAKTRTKTRTKSSAHTAAQRKRKNKAKSKALPETGKKAKRGRKLGSNTDITPPYKIEEMFFAWAESGSFAEAARLSDCDPRTVARYHDKYNWPLRLERIHARLIDEVDADIIEVKGEMLRELSVIRKRALFTFMSKRDLKAKDAANIYDRALKAEMLVRGEATSRSETLVGRAAERRAEQLKGGTAPESDAVIPEGFEVRLEVINGGKGAKGTEPEAVDTREDDTAPSCGASSKGGGS